MSFLANPLFFKALPVIASAVSSGVKSFTESADKKKKTKAELLNAARNREFEAAQGGRKRSVDMASSRANALQNIASQYVQALRR